MRLRYEQNLPIQTTELSVDIKHKSRKFRAFPLSTKHTSLTSPVRSVAIRPGVLKLGSMDHQVVCGRGLGGSWRSNKNINTNNHINYTLKRKNDVFEQKYTVKILIFEHLFLLDADFDLSSHICISKQHGDLFLF